ncbi:MAG: aa3-type cytochrome c oxidase subunit IV [Rhizobiales bacterium]|nr:aa3-type cytochrome c oxidase subunit IV [Hyphomicrobiales bacterium]
MDYAEHRRTYALFLGMMKWGSICTAVVLALMAIFLL